MHGLRAHENLSEDKPMFSSAIQEQLAKSGFTNLKSIWANLSTPALYEQIIQRHEGLLAHLGPIVTRTGNYTGRSPEDKFIVKESSSEAGIDWGKNNRPFSQDRYDALRKRLMAYFQGRELFVQDCYLGANPEYSLPTRVITEKAWHSLFARNMFVRELEPEKLETFRPRFTLIDAADFKAVPEEDGSHSEAFILLHFGRNEAIIGGTAYAGEIKKTMHTVMSFLLPQQNVLAMHCAANYGANRDDLALFFGLSGTGKTTLSADPERTLIGDDEHGWGESGVFNFEGGCYAKVIRLSQEEEPVIWETTRRFGTILENVALDVATRRLNLDSDEFTENTRASYPITHLLDFDRNGMGGHPRSIFFLTADAFGVLPPISLLTPAQAMFHFLSGYTAKVAGTERGVREPSATFSACFGAPFMALNPVVYAKMLGDKIEKHRANVWLVNTGWTGGSYAAGSRIKLAHTRAMVRAVLNGSLQNVTMQSDPIFGLQMPRNCPDVPEEILHPRKTWADKSAYDLAADKLAEMFRKNFEQFASEVSEDVRSAAPPG